MKKFIVVDDEQVIGEGDTESEAIKQAEDCEGDFNDSPLLYQLVSRLVVGISLKKAAK